MGLDNLLAQREAAIVASWVEHVVNTYAPDSAHFYKNQKDQFANPVGVTFSESLARVFTALRTGGDREEMDLQAGAAVNPAGSTAAFQAPAVLIT